jgi:hypothetical protein
VPVPAKAIKDFANSGAWAPAGKNLKVVSGTFPSVIGRKADQQEDVPPAHFVNEFNPVTEAGNNVNLAACPVGARGTGRVDTGWQRANNTKLEVPAGYRQPENLLIMSTVVSLTDAGAHYNKGDFRRFIRLDPRSDS